MAKKRSKKDQGEELKESDRKKRTKKDQGEELKMSDIRVFLEAYNAADEGNVESLYQLWEKIGIPTTVIGQMTRLCHFLYEGSPKTWRIGSGIEGLFHPKPGEGVKPTKAAEELFEHFSSDERQL